MSALWPMLVDNARGGSMSRIPSLLLVLYAIVTLGVAIWIADGSEPVRMPVSILRAAAGLVGAWGLLNRRRWARWVVLALTASEVWVVVSVGRHAALLRDLVPHFAVWRASHWVGLGLVVLATVLAVGPCSKPAQHKE